MPGGDTIYNKTWESTYSWISPDLLNNKQAFCKLCKKTFKINNSGIGQVRQHSECSKHKKSACITGQSTLSMSATGSLQLNVPGGSKFFCYLHYLVESLKIKLELMQAWHKVFFIFVFL